MECKQHSNEVPGDVGSNRKLVGSDHFSCCGIQQRFCPCGVISPIYFFLISMVTVFLHVCFSEDCNIKGKWLLNKCLPSFLNRWKPIALGLLFLFLFAGTFVFCLWTCGCVLRLRRVWLQDLHINAKPHCRGCFPGREKKKKIDVYTEEEQRTKATTRVSTVLPCAPCIGLTSALLRYLTFRGQLITSALKDRKINIYSRPSSSRVNHSQNHLKPGDTKEKNNTEVC